MSRLLVLALLVLATPVHAQLDVDLERLGRAPGGATTVEVRNADTPVFLSPGPGGVRRGTLARGTRLPVMQRLAADGCAGAWVRVGRSLYLCDRHTRYSRASVWGRTHPVMDGRDLLPYDYAFVAYDGTRAFARPSDYFVDDYIEALGEGFGVILNGHRFYDGIPFVRTRRRLWIEANQVRRARGSEFRGVELDGELNVAWVSRRNAGVHERRGGRLARRAGAREVVRIASVERGWARLDDGTWMRLRDLARAERVEVPEEVPEGGTWIDVDVDSQVLVAYRGETPVYATLVSTGKSRPSHETPRGVHRVWVKLAYSDMDNLERDDISSNYAIERVPWVQYFEGANGLHAAFWHDDFGRRKSHGCVNLSPRDARWIFDFTEPELPTGWTAIFPRPDEATTWIQVR